MPVGGVEDLRAIGKALKATGAKDLKVEMRSGIREATKPLIRAVQNSARDTLPKRGGLNEWVAASRFTTSMILSGSNVGIRIRGVKGDHNLRRLDAGFVRHPVFGTWRAGMADERVTPGFFTKPLEASGPLVEATLYGVLNRTARRIESL